MNYVGLDIHKTFCHATIMAEDGTIVKNGKFETNEEELQQFFSGISDAQIVIEASGMWEPYYEILEKSGVR
ncbi:MAG: IS110 family transposase [Thermoplasmatota archaeon]|jgi:predicted NBD/HSP70 family sugar kinase